MSHRSHFTTPRLVAATAAIMAAGTLGVTSVAGPAWATSGSKSATPGASAQLIAKTDDLPAAKAKVDARITKAVTGIDKLSAALAKSTGLSAASKTSLTSKLATLRQQLLDAKTKADAATDVAALRTAVTDVLSNLKSKGVAGEGRAVVVSERARVAIDRLTERIPAVQDRLNAAKAKGTDVTAAQAALTDLQAKLADAKAKVGGLADAVVSGHTTPAAAKTALEAVKSDLKAVRADGQIIKKALGGGIKAP